MCYAIETTPKAELWKESKGKSFILKNSKDE